MPLYIKMPENINETTSDKTFKTAYSKKFRHVAFCCFIVINII